MLIEILRHTPLWVWALLTLLLVLGWSQTRDRDVAVRRLVILPLVMLGLGLSTLWPAMRQLPAVAAPWLACGALAFIAAARWLVPRDARWNAATRRLQVPGSAWPMALIMATFLLKYSIGVFQGLQPAAASAPGYLAALAAVSGALSGLWLGRAHAMLRLTRGSQQEHTMPGHDPARIALRR